MSNTDLAIKVRDLDKLLDEYEFNFHSFKLKQQSLEKRIESLEREFSKLKHLPFKNKTNLPAAAYESDTNHINDQKLIAVEKSHKILEKELKLLKDVQLADLENIKENIDLLQTQIFGEISKSISQNSLSQLGSIEYLQKQCTDIQERLNQLRKRKKDSTDMPKDYCCFKQEMREQFNNLVEERRLFELEKNLLTQDFEKLTENAGIQLTVNTNDSDVLSSIISPHDIFMQESIIELEKKTDEWEQKYKSELDTFNQQSQQHEQQIKQLKEQLLAAKINNEAKNLDLTNQLKLLNSDEEFHNSNTTISNDDALKSHKEISIIEKTDSENSTNNNLTRYQLQSLKESNETEKHKNVELIDGTTSAALTSCRKSNLTESILELEEKLNEWGVKYNKEIDSFKNQQKEQLLLNQKEESQIKLLKEQITAAKLVSESSDEIEIIDSFKYRIDNNSAITTNNIDDSKIETDNTTNKARSNIKESILNLEAKFNHLEQIYNTESIPLDNKLRVLSNTFNRSTSNLSNQNSKQLITESNNALLTVNNNTINLDDFSLFNIKSALSCQSFKSENELIKITKSTSAECILLLEDKLHEWERKHQREIEIFNALSKQQETQIKELKEKLNNEALQIESLNSDYSLLQSEANRLEVLLKQKCESLEYEINETNKLNEYEYELAIKNKKCNQIYENYDKEINSLVEQISHLQKGLKFKEEEFHNLEKLIEIERIKTASLIKQIEDLNCINIQLNMQNNEAKSRLVTLDLLTDECIQLRKNLTFIRLKA